MGELPDLKPTQKQMEPADRELPVTEKPSIPAEKTEKESLWNGTEESESFAAIPGEESDLDLLAGLTQEESDSVPEAPAEKSAAVEGKNRWKWS